MRVALASLLLVLTPGCSLLLGEGFSGDDDPATAVDGGSSGSIVDGATPDSDSAPSTPGDSGCPDCAENAPVALDTMENVSDVAADESGVYWVDNSSGDIRAADPDGSRLRTLCHAKAAPQVLALDELNVFWAEAGQSRVRSIAKTAIEGVPSFVQVDSPRFIARGGTDVYTYDNVNAKVYRTSTSLVAPTLVVDLGAQGLLPGYVVALSADPTGVFVGISGGTNRVRWFPRMGGNSTDVTSPVGELMSCAVDDARVYVASKNDGVVRSNAKAGGGDVVYASGSGTPVDVAVDATDVYWTTAEGNVLRASKAGGQQPVTIAQGQTLPGAIAVNSRAIYWVNDKKTVMMLRKP